MRELILSHSRLNSLRVGVMNILKIQSRMDYSPSYFKRQIAGMIAVYPKLYQSLEEIQKIEKINHMIKKRSATIIQKFVAKKLSKWYKVMKEIMGVNSFSKYSQR